MGRWRAERSLIPIPAGQPGTLAVQRHRNVRAVVRRACAVARPAGQPPGPWAALRRLRTVAASAGSPPADPGDR